MGGDWTWRLVIAEIVSTGVSGEISKMTTTTAPAVSRTRPSFYVWMMVTCAVIAVLGFAPTYFVPMAQGAFRGSALVHIHGALFFAWTAFVIYQTSLVASGRVAHHREIGLAGIALATTMVVLGFAVSIVAANHQAAAGFEEGAKAFLIVPPSLMVFFGIVVAFAVANVRRPEWHKRLLVVATVSLLEAPIARWFLTFLAPPGANPLAPPPVAVALMPGLVGNLLIVAAVIYDWRTRGRPHPAYLIAGGALLVLQLVREPISTTQIWTAIATWLMSIGG
jgi:hypothetical protein